jgi:hypothetical protein
MKYGKRDKNPTHNSKFLSVVALVANLIFLLPLNFITKKEMNFFISFLISSPSNSLKLNKLIDLDEDTRF